MRPKQWIKNTIIFIPLLFSGELLNSELLKISVLGFIIFNFFVGTIYILNDFKDLELDKIHPKKKYRPLALGTLNQKFAWYSMILINISCLILSYILFGKVILFFFLLYLLNTAIYVYSVKNIVILDVFSIAGGFILRGLIGIYIVNVEFSIWFLLILFFGALILGFLKRYQEVKLGLISRKNIKLYNEEFLKQIISMLTTLIVMSYSFYTFNSIQSEVFTITIPLVLFGIIRFIYNIFYLEKYEEGIENIILQDKFIVYDLIIYIIVISIIIYF